MHNGTPDPNHSPPREPAEQARVMQRHEPPRFDELAQAIDRTIEALTRLRSALPQFIRGPQASAAPATAPAPAAATRPAARPAIEVHGLTKRFGTRLAVDGLSFQVPTGSITGFVGPNGSGKTTAIRLLLHLSTPDAGTASVLGTSIQYPTAYLPKVGALIEAPAFDPGLSGAKNLRVQATLAGHPTVQVPALLRLVGLTDAGSKPYATYSLGMKQRLGIAAALLGNPQLLILDEPTNGLDPAGIREIRSLLVRVRATGRTIFVSSHLLDEVQRMCDHLVVIRKGRLVYQGSVAGFGGRTGDLEKRFLELTET